jgi:hypothetical protein
MIGITPARSRPLAGHRRAAGPHPERTTPAGGHDRVEFAAAEHLVERSIVDHDHAQPVEWIEVDELTTPGLVEPPWTRSTAEKVPPT